MNFINLTFTNGTELSTCFNSEVSNEEIVNHYNDNNFLGNKGHQVRKLEIVREGDMPGCRQRNIVYMFEYDPTVECYLY